MKKKALLIMLATGINITMAQNISLEALAGQDHIFYQQGFSTKFSSSSIFGFMQAASYISRYNSDMGKTGTANEVMNQVYISTNITRSFSLLTGIFYTNATGITASAALRFVHTFKNGLLVLVPRADIQHHGTFECMDMLEYTLAIKRTNRLYTKLQVMSNTGPYRHNRSWQRLRVGIDWNGTQLGIGLNLDEYGTGNKTKLNTGIFIRKRIL